MIDSKKNSATGLPAQGGDQPKLLSIKENIPDSIKDFPENYDFLVLYDEWRRGGLKLTCNSIMDSIVVLPNGDIPICQNLDTLIGNVYEKSLDSIIHSKETHLKQKKFSKNCNECWINFHRKYDVILYRFFEKYFGKYATGKLLGYYWWESEKKKSYKQMTKL
ncbi:MAG: SPASM domain-containing protein [Chitinophagaceae bacterium]|nr:SPASM domain-containing protein [Chitinophagaceae bacterium]